MKVIIAVDSVFQLVCALNIAYVEFPNDENIILFRDTLWNTDKKLLLKENPLFEKLYYTNKVYKNINQARKWQMEAFISPTRAISKLFEKELLDYEASAIISSTSVDYLVPLYKIYRRKSPMLYLVEEGIGEYTNKNRSFGKKSKLKKFKSSIKGRTKINNIAIRRYLLPKYENNINIKIKKAPYLSTNPEFKENILKIFNGSQVINELSTTSIIYFEQPFTGESNTQKISAEFKDFESKILAMLLTGRNAKIKLHPRSSNTTLSEYSYIHSTTPWEAILPSINLNNKILISISSTSIVTPKLMLDQEPIIICLLKICGEFLTDLIPYLTKDDIEKQLNFFNLVKNKYSDPNRFFIPSSLEELEMYMRKNYPYI